MVLNSHRVIFTRLNSLILGLSVGCTLVCVGDGNSVGSDYWAYQKPQRASVPDIKSDFVRNPIDAFVLKGLQEEGLKPNPPAPPRHLVRRVYYDITGLPPTLPEVEAFSRVVEGREAAWGALVDKLLASERYGEKLASLWLDVVRYAETNAFERDKNKPYIWRYRDYVITSFNENKPYDRFVAEQLAGDELPDSDVSAKVATGFMTLMQRDDEPADRDQAHSDMLSDIVDVSSEAFLGMTMACAKCHDHKGDPILQSDYYSMMSFFDTIVSSHLNVANKTWYSDEDALARDNSVKAVNAAWRQVDTGLLDDFVKVAKSPKPMIRFGYGKDVKREELWKILPELPEDPSWTFPSYVPKDFREELSPFSTEDHGLNAIFREARKDEHYAPIPREERPLVLRKEFGLTALPEKLIFYAQGRLITSLDIYFNGVKVFGGEVKFRGAYIIIPFSREHVSHLTTGKNAISIVVTPKDPKHGYWFDPGFYHNAVAPLSIEDIVVMEPKLVGDIYGEEFRQLIQPLVEEKQRIFANPGNPYLSVDEKADVPPARIHLRGSVHAEGAEVPMAIPVVLMSDDPLIPPSPEAQKAQYKLTNTTGRRRALAEWVIDPENPLTARVMVNRLWQHCFGLGLVPSASDFGVLGEGVSNKALLDWLAVEFMESGWNIKHMLRLMLTSSTYQMSVQVNEQAVETDPENQLHWRHNPRRLTAEEIWDTFLLIQGKLNLALGGESVRPKMPEAVLAGSSQPELVWPETEGDAAHRRAVYIHVKRSIQLPMLAAYDAPQRDAPCPTRFATTVPTQALTMLNSERVNTVAKDFAVRVAAEYPELNTQVRSAYEIALGRPATAVELEAMQTLCNDLKSQFSASEATALERVCLILLNLNETIYLD